ncbi:hypothetical protein CR513_33102, partial [Mucuna pruriens]
MNNNISALGVKHSCPRIFCVNLSTVALAYNVLVLQAPHKKTLAKHIEVVHVPAADQRANILTKTLQLAFAFLTCASTLLDFEIPFNKLFNKQLDFKFLSIPRVCLPRIVCFTHKGYKCLSPAGQTFISKDVIFNEHRFQYSVLFPSHDQPSPTSTTLPTLSVLPSPITSPNE